MGNDELPAGTRCQALSIILTKVTLRTVAHVRLHVTALNSYTFLAFGYGRLCVGGAVTETGTSSCMLSNEAKCGIYMIKKGLVSLRGGEEKMRKHMSMCLEQESRKDHHQCAHGRARGCLDADSGARELWQTRACRAGVTSRRRNWNQSRDRRCDWRRCLWNWGHVDCGRHAGSAAT